jgi:hypothetical protein
MVSLGEKMNAGAPIRIKYDSQPPTTINRVVLDWVAYNSDAEGIVGPSLGTKAFAERLGRAKEMLIEYLPEHSEQPSIARFSVAGLGSRFSELEAACPHSVRE